MKLTRRATILAAMGTAFVAVLPMRATAAADAAIADFTGGAAPGANGITLTAPEIAENGNTVPIEVSAPGATEIRVYAAGNPTPDVATFLFGPLAAAQMASTRIRLAGTQHVVAVAKMADGSFAEVRQEVKVTIGGCGG
ncbi:thiosulfate oxidation carrier protein SoxY [Loktanella sp. SALINAS62]|uniref:thiosulfate oxidation carrier protein SoxY n=1 Tax=Loktanella sp. SALINAS62 TaxID=2706124 RepID=UPI001B8CD716|nr:thiosulfate oxidation carrier protein SoxY [Loktanella sp. SALINAS62]MBS1302036.1 thiosulfate oxidation carrier protein SoxY [Loktanella sp. SALINAS62]